MPNGPARMRGWSFFLIGAVVAIVLLVGVGGPGLLLSHGTVCKLGDKIGTYTIWTPNQLVNIPDGGNVSYATSEWNVADSSGSLTLNKLQPPGGPVQSSLSGGSGLNRAGIWVGYGDYNWTFYRAVNDSVTGESSAPCGQPYVAELNLPGGGCGGWAVVPLIDNTTDAVEPHVWNGTAGFNGTEDYPGCPVQTPGTYASFDSSLHGGLSGAQAEVNWNLCGVSGFKPLVLFGIAEVPVALHVPFEGNEISVMAKIESYDSPALKIYLGPTVSYLVPGGWNWTLAPVGPVGSAINPDLPLHGLIAFERMPC